MRKFKKYAFNDQTQAESYIDALSTEEEPTNNAIVKCGHILEVAGEYDEQGNETTPPIYSEKYMVDVMWIDKKDKEWKDFRYKLNGKKNYHTFAGVDYSDNTN